MLRSGRAAGRDDCEETARVRSSSWGSLGLLVMLRLDARAVRRRRVRRAGATARLRRSPPARLVRPRHRPASSRCCSSTRRRSGPVPRHGRSLARAPGRARATAGSASVRRVALRVAAVPPAAPPEPRRVPGRRSSTRSLTAFFDEALFRGAVLGLSCSRPAARPDRDQPRSRRPDLRARDAPRARRARHVHARAARWSSASSAAGLALLTGGIARRLPRPRHHAVRGLPDDRPRRPRRAARARCRRTSRSAAARPTAGASVESDARLTADGGPSDRPMAPPVVRPGTPPVALYVHVPFCVSICPYCDFVVVCRARPRAGRANRIAAFVAALAVELELRADVARRSGSAGADAAVLESLYLGGGTPLLLPGRRVAALLELVRDRFGLTPGCRGDARGQSRARTSAATSRGLARRRRDAPVDRRPEPRRRGACGAWAAAHAGRRRRDAVGRRARPGSRSVSLDLLYDVPRPAGRLAATLDAALALEPDHLSLYALTLDDPDAEGLTGPLRRPPAARPAPARGAAAPGREQDEDRAAAMYEHADERLAAAGCGGYEISNCARPGPRESPQPGLLASAGRRRRSGPARTPSTATGALERRPSRRLPGRAAPPAGSPPASRPAARSS